MPINAALIVAAGSGSRARRDHDTVAKQYVSIAGKAVLCWTLEKFLASDAIDCIQVVIADGDHDLYEQAVQSLYLGTLEDKARTKLAAPIAGGDTRQKSVWNGLQALNSQTQPSQKPDTILIHDAARPFVSEAILTRCHEALKSHRACLVAAPLTDTIKQVDDKGKIIRTLDRTMLWAAQTPQAFAFSFILDAHQKAANQPDLNFTDDAAVAEWAGASVYVIEGEPTNIKLTNREDLDMAEEKLAKQATPPAPLTDFRVGTGFDVHAFEDGDAVIIGGVSIPHSQKLKGHSDADVGLHTITDAILGAIADGDIGTHFPPSDPQWKGAASDLFLKDAVRRVKERGGKISNIDLTIMCELPKIGPHRPAIRKRIAEICDMPIDRISVKATTTEQLGFTGRKEGIAALASVAVRLPETD